MPFRKYLFWIHLTCALIAGPVILMLCVTGVLLTYSRQMTVWSDRQYWSPPAVAGQQAPLSEFVARARAHYPSGDVTGLVVYPAPTGPIGAVVGQRWLYFDPSTAEIRGWNTEGMRRFLGFVQGWHRWLNFTGERRAAGRLVTGVGNVVALFLVVSGLYLWIPRRWRWQHVKPILLYNRKAKGKARDFNWHHVFGFWMWIPLFLVVGSAVMLSFPWAMGLGYRVAGATPPTPPQRRSEAPEPPAPFDVTILDPILEPALEVTGWEWISVSVPPDSATPILLVASTGWGGEAWKRHEWWFDSATGEETAYESFEDFSLDRRVRILARYTHSGEHYGLWGQAVAGLASLAGVLMVWSGFALAWRRFVHWLKRPSTHRTSVDPASERDAT